MHTICKRLRPIILAALAAGGFTAPTQAADLIAFWDFERVEAEGTSIKAATGNSFLSFYRSSSLLSFSRCVIRLNFYIEKIHLSNLASASESKFLSINQRKPTANSGFLRLQEVKPV
jgi:hypothetical protein